MAFASHGPFTIKIADDDEARYLGNPLSGPVLRRLRDIAWDPEHAPTLMWLRKLAQVHKYSFRGTSFSVAKSLEQDHPEAHISASQTDYELCVMMSGPNNELWTPDMESLLVECYNAKTCNSVYEITFALSGKFSVGLTDQETYKKLQRMKLDGRID